MYKKILKWWWVGIPILSFVVFRYVFDFHGLYGQDAHEYQRYANELNQYFYGGSQPGRFFWPVNFPFLGSLISMFGVGINFAMQGLAAIGLCTFLYFLVLLLKESNGRLIDSNHAVLFSCLICYSPFVFRSGVVIMSESIALAFITAALYYFARSRRHHSIDWNSYLFLFTCSLAVGTRYALVVLIAPLVTYWLWSKRKSLSLRNSSMIFLLILVAISANLLLKLDFAHGFWNHDLLARWSLRNFFSSSFSTDNGLVIHEYVNIIYYGVGLLHLKLFWWFLPMIYFAIKLWKRENRAYLIAILCYLLFLFGIPEQNARYLVPTAPLLGVLVFPAFVELLTKLQGQALRIGLIVLVLAVQSLMVGRTMSTHLTWSKMERNIASRVNEYEKTTLYTFAIDQALTSYGCLHDIKNLYEEELMQFDIGGLVLFNEKSFQIQWQDLNPMINWKKLQQEYIVEEELAFSEGWALYRIAQEK